MLTITSDYNWCTIYHLANDCNDTFTLIQTDSPGPTDSIHSLPYHTTQFIHFIQLYTKSNTLSWITSVIF